MFELTADQFRLLASRGVNRTDLREYARRVIGADKEQSKWTPAQTKKVGAIVGSACEGRGNKGQNWWHAYNGLTEYLSYGAGRKADTRLNSLWFGDGAELSRKGLEIALEMCLGA